MVLPVVCAHWPTSQAATPLLATGEASGGTVPPDRSDAATLPALSTSAASAPYAVAVCLDAAISRQVAGRSVAGDSGRDGDGDVLMASSTAASALGDDANGHTPGVEKLASSLQALETVATSAPSVLEHVEAQLLDLLRACTVGPS